MATTIRENLHASKRACCFALQNFVIPTGAKRYPRRAPFFARWGIGAEWRGLLFSPSTLCHPDRSEAERSDLLSATRKDAGLQHFHVDRIGETCCSPLNSVSSRPERRRGPRPAPFLRSVGRWSGAEEPAFSPFNTLSSRPREAEWRDLLLATRKDAGHPPFVIPNRSGILRRSFAASTNAVVPRYRIVRIKVDPRTTKPEGRRRI
jgi:hypothetical protein